MTPEDLKAALRSIVIRHSRLTLATVEEGQALAGELGYDSLAFVTALADIEDHFGIAFPLERIADPGRLTFGELARLVGEEIARDAGAGSSGG